MGSARTGQFLDFGAPEYFVTDIEVEVIPESDLVRIYAANRRGEEKPLQYTALIPRNLLMKINRAIRENIDPAVVLDFVPKVAR
jgi:hypothetical protein